GRPHALNLARPNVGHPGVCPLLAGENPRARRVQTVNCWRADVIANRPDSTSSPHFGIESLAENAEIAEAGQKGGMKLFSIRRVEAPGAARVSFWLFSAVSAFSARDIP